MKSEYSVRIEGIVPALKLDDYGDMIVYIVKTHEAIIKSEDVPYEPIITIYARHSADEAVVEEE